MAKQAKSNKLLQYFGDVNRIFTDLSVILKINNPVLLLDFERKVLDTVEFCQDNQLYKFKMLLAKIHKLLSEYQDGTHDEKYVVLTIQNYSQTISNYLDIQKIEDARKRKATIINRLLAATKKLISSIIR